MYSRARIYLGRWCILGLAYSKAKYILELYSRARVRKGCGNRLGTSQDAPGKVVVID